MSRRISVFIRLMAMVVMGLTPLAGTLVPTAAQGAGATVQLTMRGCPEGFDPATDDFQANCTIPLDAPDASTITSGQRTVAIPFLERQSDGSYLYATGPGEMDVHLNGLAPVLRNAYHVVGVDESEGERFVISLVDGETRQVFVFYYYAVPGSAPDANPVQGTATVRIATANALSYPVHTVCYELIELAIHACVNPATETVEFRDLSPGRYTARQTEDLGDNYVPDFSFDVPADTPEIRVATTLVTPWGSPSRIGKIDDVEYVDYDFATWPGSTDNVTVVFMDASSGEIARIDGCVRIVGVTPEACTGQLGQVTFDDIAAGPHEIEVTTLPDGYSLAPGMEALPLENPGGSPNGPMRIIYFIDVVPAVTETPSIVSVADPPVPPAGTGSGLITICASNRHGVDYQALIFNLTPEAAIQAGFLIDDGRGNLIPEWQGVDLGECLFASGFHLYEYVAHESATVTYCDNGESREGPANTIGVTFIDPSQTGQSRISGITLIDWKTAPDGVIPGPCSAPVALNGEKLYAEIVGAWEGAGRSAFFYDDGTGVIRYSENADVDFVELDVLVDTSIFPVTATVVNVTSVGNPGMARYPAAGDTISLMVAPFSILDIQVVPGWTVSLCLPGTEEIHFTARCFE